MYVCNLFPGSLFDLLLPHFLKFCKSFLSKFLPQFIFSFLHIPRKTRHINQFKSVCFWIVGLHKGGPFSSNLAPIFTKTARLAAKKKASQSSQSQQQSQAPDGCEDGLLDKTAIPFSSDCLLSESTVSSSEVEILSCTGSL